MAFTTQVTAKGSEIVQDGLPNLGAISGLTTNVIPKAASATTLTDSVIKDDGTAVTITQNSVVPFTSVASGAVANTLYLNGGNVGVGTNTPASFKLQVAGDIGPDGDSMFNIGSGANKYSNISSIVMSAQTWNGQYQNQISVNDIIPVVNFGNLPKIAWGNGDFNSTKDVGLSRISSGILGVGNGAAGSTAGALQLAALQFPTVASGATYKTGANARVGTGTLSSGTLAVANTSITANSFVFVQDTGGGVIANIGALYVASQTVGVGFTVSSSNVIDTSNFRYWIFETN
jgi:hypothetical protein